MSVWYDILADMSDYLAPAIGLLIVLHVRHWIQHKNLRRIVHGDDDDDTHDGLTTQVKDLDDRDEDQQKQLTDLERRVEQLESGET